MCYFNLLVISNDIAVESAREAAETGGFHWSEWCGGEPLAATETAYHLGNYCDCGTVLGAVRRKDRPDFESDVQKQLVKLRRRGWNEAKIKRWLGEKEKVKARDERVRADLAGGVGSERELTKWIELLQAVDAIANADSFVGLIQIWSELAKAIPRRNTPLRDLDSSFLADINEGVLYRFIR